MVTVLLFLWLSAPLSLTASSDKVRANEWAAEHISPLLLLNADVVVRQDNRHFEYQAPGEGRLHVHRVITILNEDGLRQSSIQIPYSSFVNIRQLSGAVYDAQGERLTRIRSRDFDDESSVSAISLAEDSRVKSGQFTHSRYPFTIELEYQIDYSGYLQIPAWIPITHERTSLEVATLKIEIPEHTALDYRSYKLSDNDLIITSRDHVRTYTWNLKNRLSVEREILGPPWFELLPAVVARTEAFSMDGHHGSMKDWNSFGAWIGELWKDRDYLPDHLKADVDALVAQHGTPDELIRQLYKKLQENTRYVSIQLGIGGFQTESAWVTAENRYGDCKALSNYLLAMLRYAGFDAYPALIRNGAYSFPFDPDFVQSPFNHAVVAVITESDTTWVEATSSTFPLGYIGSSNYNRHALIFWEDGGELVRTPRLTADDNFQRRTADVHIREDGSASLTVHTRYGGSQHERVRTMARQPQHQQRRYLESMLPHNLFKIEQSAIEPDPYEPEAAITLDVEISTFSNVLGSRLIFQPNAMERFTQTLPDMPSRSQPVYLSSAYYDVDEITYYLPENYRIEALPSSEIVEFEYGTYSSTYTFTEEARTLTFRRELRMLPGVLPAENYNVFRSFRNQIVRTDNAQAVLVRD